MRFYPPGACCGGDDIETVERPAHLSLETGIPAQEGIESGLSKGMARQAEVLNKIEELGIESGLSKGMARLGELFAGGEYFVPEAVVCADTLYESKGKSGRHLYDGSAAW